MPKFDASKYAFNCPLLLTPIDAEALPPLYVVLYLSVVPDEPELPSPDEPDEPALPDDPEEA